MNVPTGSAEFVLDEEIDATVLILITIGLVLEPPLFRRQGTDALVAPGGSFDLQINTKGDVRVFGH